MGLFEDITGLTTNKSKKTNKNVLDFKTASNNYLLESDRAKARIDKLNQLNDREARDLSIALQEKERARDEYLKNNKNKSIQSVNANFERNYDNTAINESQRRYNETHKGLDMFSLLGQSGLELLDFGKRTAATGLDLGLDVLQGGLNQLEGGVDWATYRLADVADFFGGKSLAEDLKRNADFSSTNALFGTSQNEQDNLFGNWQKGIEETSYSPDILDNIGQSVGQVLMMGGTSLLTGGSALGTAGVVYASAYGNARSEAKRNGASDEEANKVGIINGVAETISEQFFSGIPGMKVEGWGDKRIGKLTDKVAKYFGTNTGKVALKIFDSLGEGTEEIISNVLTAAGNDIVHYFDKDFSYGMENQSGNILEDMWDQVTNSDTWTQFISAAITSALVNGGKAFIDTKTKNKIINAYAKDNNMSFKDANYILTGQLENAKQEIKRDEIDYNSQVELQQLAEQRVLNFMKSYTGENIESTIKDELKKEQKKLGIKLNVEEQEKLEKDIRAKYEDSINSRERYTQFTQETDNEKDSALVKSMQEAKMNNTKQAHEVYDFVKSLTDKNPNAKIEFTNNELLEKQGAKITDENGNKATINGYYKDGVIHINMNTKNPYRQVVYHEIGHAIKETDEQLYNEMKNLIFELKGKERLSDYKDLYQVKDGEITSDLTDNVEDEYVNDMLGEILESDRFINTFRDNRTLLQKILDKLKEIISSITSTQEQKHFKQIEKRLQELYKQGYEQAEFTGNEKTDYSLLDIFKKKSNRERSYDISDEFKQEIEQRTRNNLANNDKVQFINIDDIKRNGETGGYRTIDETDSLINNIMAEGMKAPIRVYKNENGDTLIYDGNHRYEAAKRLGLKEIPVVYETHSDTQYSLSSGEFTSETDNLGRTLSDNQKEYFKNSKVVDQNGNLQVLYNGSGNHTVYLPGFMSDESIWGKGIYLTPYKDIAEMYGNDVKETYVNIEKPIASGKNLTFEQYNEFYKAAHDGEEAYIEDYNMYDDDFDLLWDATNKGIWADYADELKEYTGYDGIIVNNPDAEASDQMVIAFKSNQIKNVDNLNPTKNEDIRFSLSVSEANTGKDNSGNKLSKQQQEYFRNSMATDEKGNLIQVFHTTTDEIPQFNEFNPVGTPYYKFGDQVVNYFTDSKEMSGSYADNYYEMADTKKLNTLEEAQIWLDSINSDLSIENNNIYGDNIEPEIKYENEEQLLKYLKSDVQRLIGEEARIQYQGYVNITNPYVIDAEGRYWNKVESKGDTEKTTRLINTPAEIKQELIDMANDSIHSFDETYFNWKQADNAVNYVARDRTNVTLEQRILNRMIHELEYQDVREILDGKGSWGKKISFMDFLHHEDFITEQEYQEFKKTDKISQEILDRINNKLNAPLKYEDRYMANELEALGLPLEIKETTLNDLWRTREEAYKAYDENGRDESSQFVKKMMKAENELKYSRYGKIDDLFYVAKNDFTDDYIRQQYNDWSVTNDIVKKIIDLNNYGENYDGVIIKNVVDYGGRSDTQEAHDLYITFNSNQFKASDNLNPTEDSDIRYQLTQNQNQQTGFEGTQENLPTGLENTKLIETTEDYKNTLPRTNLPINTQEEDNELPFYTEDELETVDERMQDRRRKYADERFKKIMEKQTYKSIDSATKMAKNYLGFNQQETKDFKSKIEKLSQLSKDKLIKAKNYNQLKDIIKQYATKDQTFINQELRDAQKEIRNTELIVSDDLKAQITDWSDFKKYSGLKIRAGIRSNVDSVYQELLESYTGMLDNTITNYADQLQELSEFVKRDNKYIEHFELTEDAINQITNKVWDKLSQNALTEQEINDLQQEITEKAERRTREVVRNDLLEQMGITEQDLQVGKDISSIGYQRTDPRRLNEKVFGYEVGNKINQATNGFVQHQEANKIRWLNKERNEISDLGIKPKSKMSAAIQKYGEKQYVNDKGEVIEYNDQTLMSEFPNVADQEKIKNAVEVLRQKYDEYIDKMNESLMEMGYDPVPKRKDYFRHFIELEDKLSQFGFTFSKENIMKEELPTDINGLTDGFKPGKNFFASAMARKGLKTTYDAITGIDQYLSGVSDVIYHTESIQRYRALSKFIRDTYGQTHGTENIDMMSEEEAQQRIQDVYDNKLSRYAAWLDEQANALANKKAAIDRSVERIVGRKGYTLLNGLKKQVGSNMTGFNVRSAMTNFASAIQGASKTEKLSALQGFAFALKNYRNVDALVEKSDMLATRFGTDLLSKKTWQKMSEAGQVFMNATDRFTTLQIWGGKYYEGLHHGLSEQEAIKQADDFTSRIMGDRSKGQTAEIFNSKTLGLFTQFQLEVNNQWSSMIHDNKMAMKQNPGLRTGLHIANQLGQLYAATWFFNNFMKVVTGSEVIFDPIDILMGIFSPDDDKNIEEKTTEALGKIINELPMASVFTGGRIPLSEAFTGIDTGFKYITGQKDKYGNNYTPEDVKNDFLGSIAYYLLPTGYGQLKKTTQGLSMYNNELPGSYTDSGKLRFEADTSPLGILQSAVFGQYASGNAREYFDNGYSPLTEKQVNEAMDVNLPIAEYREIDKGIKEAKKEAKESGKSQSEAQYNYIYNLPISMEQKNTLINSRLGTSDNVTDDNGYVKYTDGNKTYWYDESNDTVYNSKYREMDNIDIKDLTKYSNKKDLTDYGKYRSLDEFNFATNNPTKYSTIQQITSYDNYVKYKDDISAIKDNYNDNTKQGQKKAQQKVFNYINSLPLNKYQKIMLQKIGAGYSIKNYEKQVFKYINGLQLSKAEKQKIHKELFE